jgi:hypothetical protein
MKLSVKIAGIFAVVAFALTAVSADAAFTRDLTLGSTGSDVMELQQWLNKAGYTVAASGAGSVGMETSYFGPATQAALARWQAANQVTPAAGYFGPITRAKIIALGTPSTPDDDEDDEDEDNGDLSGGEASLENFDMTSGDDSEVEEGDSASIAEIEFDVEDGDVQIDRIDLQLVGSSTEEEDPWDAFDSLRLLVDGDEIGEADLSDEDNYLDEDDGTIRISGIDYVVREGETVTIVVEVTTQGSVDGADSNDSAWTISVDGDEGIRATDAEGIQQYIGGADEVDFDIEEEGADDDLTVRSSSDDIDAASLKVEDDARSDAHPIFVFDLEAEESDMELDSIDIDLEVSSTTVDMTNVISDLVLEIDGEEFDDWSFVSGSAASTSTVRFDIDGDFTIDADSEVAVVLSAEFKAANNTNYASGLTINAAIGSGDVSAEGSDDITSDGAADGEDHTLLTAGLSVEDAPTVDSDSEDGVGTYTFEIDLTAFEEDVTIATSSTASGTGFDWSVVGGTATSTITVQSDADVVGTNFVIDEGSTETFTIVITVDPASAGSFYVILNDVHYVVDGSDAVHTFQPQSQYDTPAVSITAS